MTFAIWKLVILVVVGVVAGIVSTVAGLASLVSYPALLMLGIPPVYANVTNTTSLVFSGIGATIGSQKELRGHGKQLLILLPLTVLGSVFGSYLLLVAPGTTFEHIVPFFILAAGILLFVPFAKLRKKSHKIHSHVLVVFTRIISAIGIFLVGAYTGYFGAAGGVIMLAIFSMILDERFIVYNAYKNVTLGASNCIAAIIYIFKSHVYWILVLPLAIGFFAGGYIGPSIVRVLPVKLLRTIIGIGAFILALVLFLQAYHFI